MRDCLVFSARQSGDVFDTDLDKIIRRAKSITLELLTTLGVKKDLVVFFIKMCATTLFPGILYPPAFADLIKDGRYEDAQLASFPLQPSASLLNTLQRYSSTQRILVTCLDRFGCSWGSLASFAMANQSFPFVL